MELENKIIHLMILIQSIFIFLIFSLIYLTGRVVFVFALFLIPLSWISYWLYGERLWKN